VDIVNSNFQITSMEICLTFSFLFLLVDKKRIVFNDEMFKRCVQKNGWNVEYFFIQFLCTKI